MLVMDMPPMVVAQRVGVGEKPWSVPNYSGFAPDAKPVV